MSSAEALVWGAILGLALGIEAGVLLQRWLLRRRWAKARSEGVVIVAMHVNAYCSLSQEDFDGALLAGEIEPRRQYRG